MQRETALGTLFDNRTMCTNQLNWNKHRMIFNKIDFIADI